MFGLSAQIKSEWSRFDPGQGHCVVFLGKTLTLTVPLSTQVYIKWVPVNLMLGIPCDDITSHPQGAKILLVTSCYWNQETLTSQMSHLACMQSNYFNRLDCWKISQNTTFKTACCLNSVRYLNIKAIDHPVSTCTFMKKTLHVHYMYLYKVTCTRYVCMYMTIPLD